VSQLYIATQSIGASSLNSFKTWHKGRKKTSSMEFSTTQKNLFRPL